MKTLFSRKTQKSAKRRVLLVVRWPVGGIRTFLKYVLQYFPSDNYSFSLVAVKTDDAKFLENELDGLVDEIYWMDEKCSLIDMMREVFCLVKNKKYDLIHAHGFTSVFASFLAAFFLRRKLLVTSHYVLNDEEFSGFSGSMKKVATGLVLLFCDKVHSVSYDAESNLREFLPLFSGSRSVVIFNGIDTHQFLNSSARDLRTELEISLDCKIIGFFGRFMPPKGFRYLVDSIELLNRESEGHLFHVVCFGSGAYIREEQSDIEKRGLSEYFTFIPFIPDVSGAMKGCDLIVMPSLWEACPLQPMEALCSGVPFVGTDCMGLREVLNGTPAVKVKAGNAASLADGIKECLELGKDPFIDYVGAASKRFEVRDTVQAIHNLYAKVLE